MHILPVYRRGEKLNINFMAEYYPLYVEAAKLTLRLGAAGILFSIGIGIVCSLVGYYRIPVFKQIAAAYIELSRNTPLLVQLFFLYFGLPKIGILISSEGCAVIGLSFLGGSYMAEAFRSGLEAVEKVQTESALAIGLSHMQVMRYVVFPQALAVSVPALCANAVCSHGYELTVDVKPEHEMEKVLYAADELTGLIGATALMRPSKSVQDMEVKSVKKKFKSVNFAAGCSREVIQKGADMLGWDLTELIQKTIYAMRSCETEVQEIMGSL